MTRYFSDYADPDINDDIADELRQEDAANRRYERDLMAHPDCRDPDHPGCSRCIDDETESDDHD